MAYLADTNVIARWIQPGDPLYPVARAALRTLRNQGEQVYITPQVLTEFWSVATRPPDANGLGMTIAQVIPRVRLIRWGFAFLPETSAIYPLWQQLVETHAIVGRSAGRAASRSAPAGVL